MNRAICPVTSRKLRRVTNFKTEVKTRFIRHIHTHTNRIQAIIIKRARPILTAIQAIGVFDSATRLITFEINGHTAIKIHKVHPLIRVL